ncbi:hypothetical protein SAMN05216364_105510 [Porphyromonadaceae bacterium KHP3R9]|nr:hypothetical protein SAMN05216364_105510 [Porphyromonadaceae bacterium KHP3R9]
MLSRTHVHKQFFERGKVILALGISKVGTKMHIADNNDHIPFRSTIVKCICLMWVICFLT